MDLEFVPVKALTMCVRQPEQTGAWLSGSLPLETLPHLYFYQRGKCRLFRASVLTTAMSASMVPR
jgi:hypothetical protein